MSYLITILIKKYIYYRGLNVKSGTSSCDLDYYNRAECQTHFFVSSFQHIIHYYTMHM